jgi:hypothetical protein
MNGNLLTIGSLPGQGPTPPLPASLEDVRVRALAGDGSAARYLGDCYREGDPVPFSPRRAFRWYVRGAFAGDADAMNNLGACYHFRPLLRGHPRRVRQRRQERGCRKPRNRTTGPRSRPAARRSRHPGRLSPGTKANRPISTSVDHSHARA